MSDSANVSPTERELRAARDAAPVMLDVLKAFVVAHHSRDEELLGNLAVTAREVVTIVEAGGIDGRV